MSNICNKDCSKCEHYYEPKHLCLGFLAKRIVYLTDLNDWQIPIKWLIKWDVHYWSYLCALIDD